MRDSFGVFAAVQCFILRAAKSRRTRMASARAARCASKPRLVVDSMGPRWPNMSKFDTCPITWIRVVWKKIARLDDPPPGSVSMEFHLSKTSACHRGMQSARLVTDGDINEKHQLITEHILPRNISVLDLVTGTLHLCAKRSDMSQPCRQTWTPKIHLW